MMLYIIELFVLLCTFAFLFPTLIIFLLIFLAFEWAFSYWDRMDVPSLPSIIPFGNIYHQVGGNLSLGEQYEKFYMEFKARRVKHGGIYSFTVPEYIPIDLDLIKDICQKDFQYFVNHGFSSDEQKDPFSAHLFALEDEKWKRVRSTLTPLFAESKLKIMFETMAKCTAELYNIIEDGAYSQKTIEVKDLVCRYATDVIGSVVFGIDCNSLKNPNAEFHKHGKELFKFDSWSKRILLLAIFILPKKIVSLLSPGKYLNREAKKFFTRIVQETIEYRERNGITKKDFMQLMIQLKINGQLSDGFDLNQKTTNNSRAALTIQEITTHAYFFFLAGLEAIATTMTLALIELSLNTNIQTKLRDEIKSVLQKNDNRMTYDAIAQMTYLDWVINETLRKYPSDPVISRVSTKNYHIPGTDTFIPKGTIVKISVAGIHHDDEYYPDPDKFDPERFTEENQAKRPPFSFIPFGEGPRQCIGMQFGLMQIKAGLVTILRDCKVTLNDKIRLPVKFSKSSYVTIVEENVWLDFCKAS